MFEIPLSSVERLRDEREENKKNPKKKKKKKKKKKSNALFFLSFSLSLSLFRILLLKAILDFFSFQK